MCDLRISDFPKLGINCRITQQDPPERPFLNNNRHDFVYQKTSLHSVANTLCGMQRNQLYYNEFASLVIYVVYFYVTPFIFVYSIYRPTNATNKMKYNTYLLTPWCRVLLEKLTGLQLVKKFPAFYGTRRFINALTSLRQPSLSWARPIQSIYPHSTSWSFILILSTHLHLGLPSGFFPSDFPTKTLQAPLSSPIHATCPAHLIQNTVHYKS